MLSHYTHRGREPTVDCIGNLPRLSTKLPRYGDVRGFAISGPEAVATTNTLYRGLG